MEIFIICIVAFVTAILTFFSGFGLGTILTPVMMLFIPVEIAIGLTGIVHFFNNIFKLFLVGNHANREVLIKFGIPAVIAAFVGSWLLFSIPDFGPLFSYSIFDKQFEVFPVKFIISILLLVFALMDVIPFFSNLQFSKKHLPIGGLLSGFFGGLSGNQGALRSAFLIKAGLSKEVFVATAVVISTFVDFTRLSVYASRLSIDLLLEHKFILLSASLSAISGAYLGNKLLKKVTIYFLQITVAILLIVLSIALGLGWI